MKAVSLLLVGLLAGCGGSDQYRPLAVGDPAPAYAARTLAGDTVALASLQGHPVLLNVWATWCVPCQEEMPAIERLSERFADSGLTVVGVSVDDGSADPAVRRFMQEHGITFTILRDPALRVQRIFQTFGVPETFLLDQRGRIAHRWVGAFDAGDEATFAAVRAVL
jgi:cytochrome c biogenesis protein CcmG/thiol:disulfide interchange protein DsbE